MIQLPGGCYCSQLSVHPKNWQTKSADQFCQWYISYRFYDPNFIDENGRVKPKQIIIKGMNDLHDLKEKQEAVKLLLREELLLLQERGFNKITNSFAEIDTREITEYSLLPESLEYAFKQLNVGKQTKESAESCKKRIQKVIIHLRFQDMQLKDIKTRHARKILNTCSKLYNLSAHSFNHYRAYLLMFFKVLLREDALEYNPVLNIEKQVPLKKLKILLTAEERKKINDHFKSTDIYFYRFMHCFFHSGARPIELIRLKKEDIDLKNQYYKVVIKKGKLNEEQLRPIKFIAIDFWQAQCNEAKDGEYLFGTSLKPNIVPGTRDYITKKWQREVKKRLGVNKDFYSLKHLNLDETAALLNVEAASKMAGHTSTVITMKHYLINEKERQNELLKKVNNSFSEAYE